MTRKKKSGDVVKRQRRALLASGTLNALFLAYFFHAYMTPVSFNLPSYRPCFQSSENLGPTSQELLARLKPLPFEALTHKLESEEREYALACLVTDHHFALQKVLKQFPESKSLEFEGKTYHLYPTLKESDYIAIIQYATTEKYPFTFQGLVKKQPMDADLHSLITQSPEYKALAKLLSLPEKEVLVLLAEHPPQKEHYASKRHYLLEALIARSKTAAEILLRDDFAFAVENLDDSAVEFILSLGENKKFAEAILKTPRGDKVQSLAKKSTAPIQQETLYIVQDGDSLWKIAKRHNTTIESIRTKNGLEGDRLRPGKILKI